MSTYVLSPIDVVRLFYLLCAAAILVARLSPSLRRRFLAYGARTRQSEQTQTSIGHTSQSSLVSQFLDYAATITVPHSWFTHFYLLSLVSTCLWLWVLLRVDKLPFLPAYHISRLESAQTHSSAIICLLMMLLQGVRRLYESVQFSKMSTSRMWIGHYLFGLAFYFVTNIAVWIESISAVAPHASTLSDATPITLSVKVVVAILLFALSSVIQNHAHAYLAGLKKYTLPANGLFKHLVAPHYTAECMIYLSLAIAGAPNTNQLNWTVMCVVLLTTINLGITAEGTKSWMLDKFRDQRPSILRRWRLVPGIW